MSFRSPRIRAGVRPLIGTILRQKDPTEDQQTYNKVIRGVHGVCERANSLLKTTFKALRRVGLDPNRITKIAAAALVLLQLEYDRAI